MNNTLDTLVIVNDSIRFMAEEVEELNQPIDECGLAAIICGTIIFFCVLLIFSVSNARTAKNAHEKDMRMLEHLQAEKKIYLDFCYRIAEKKDFDRIETRNDCCDFLTKYGEQFKKVNKSNE